MKRKNKKEEPQRIRFHNKRQPFTLAGGREIPADTVFWAYPEEVPKAFHDVIVPLSEPKEEEDAVELAENEQAGPQEEDVDVPQLRILHRGGGYFDVVDFYGKQKNEKAIRKEEAKQLIRDLTGEEPEEPEK